MKAFAAWIAVFATLTFGCGSADEKPELAYGERQPVLGCEHIQSARCDIRVPACQQTLFALASCLRQDSGGTLPTVRIITEAELRSELEAAVAELEVPNPNHFEIALSMLGMAEAGSFSKQTLVNQSLSWVAAQYSSKSKRVSIIDRQNGTDTDAANSILVHEFIHALQDQAGHLEYSDDIESFDRRLARTSVVEGEAELYQTLMDAAAVGVPVETLDLKKAFWNVATLGEDKLLEQTSAYTAARSLLPYGWGAHFAYLAFAEGGATQVKTLFKPAVTCMQRVFASEDTLAREPERTPVVLPSVDATLNVFAEEQLGSTGILMLSRKLPNAGRRAWAQAWRGDLLRVYASGSSTGFLWRIALPTPSEAAHFADELRPTVRDLNPSSDPIEIQTHEAFVDLLGANATHILDHIRAALALSTR
jgi:hypothetical protein